MFEEAGGSPILVRTDQKDKVLAMFEDYTVLDLNIDALDILVSPKTEGETVLILNLETVSGINKSLILEALKSRTIMGKWIPLSVRILVIIEKDYYVEDGDAFHNCFIVNL